MDRSHWKANNSTTSPDIPRTLCNQKLHYRIYISTSYAHNLSQINPLQVTTLHLPSTLILCSNTRTCQTLQLVSIFRASPENIYTALFCPWCATRSNHQVLLGMWTGVISGEAYKSRRTSTSEFLHQAVTSSFLGPYTLLLNTLSPHASRNVTEQVFKPIRSKKAKFKINKY
jgi:hypothetical protein